MKMPTEAPIRTKAATTREKVTAAALLLEPELLSSPVLSVELPLLSPPIEEFDGKVPLGCGFTELVGLGGRVVDGEGSELLSNCVVNL